jgi:quercetin dioxygenase-like cupin family protein
MSTHNANTNGEDVSKVSEIEVFYPGLEGYNLDGTQAGRLLLYEQPVWLDTHTHPLAQHAIVGREGRGAVRFDEREYPVEPGSLFVVPPDTVHQLGSTGDMRAFVVNSPGIPPTDPNYSHEVFER